MDMKKECKLSTMLEVQHMLGKNSKREGRGIYYYTNGNKYDG